MNPSRLATLAKYHLRSTWWLWLIIGVVAAVVDINIRPETAHTFGNMWWRIMPENFLLVFGYFVGRSARKSGYNQFMREGTALERLLGMLTPIIPLILVKAASIGIWTGGDPQRFSTWFVIDWMLSDFIYYTCAMVVGLRPVRWTWLAPLLSIQGLNFMSYLLNDYLTATIGFGFAKDSLVILGLVGCVGMVCWWAWTLLRFSGNGREDVSGTRLAMATMLMTAGVGFWGFLAIVSSRSEMGAYMVAHIRPPVVNVYALLDYSLSDIPYWKNPFIGGASLGAIAVLGIILFSVLSSFLLGRHRGLRPKLQAAWMVAAGIMGPISLLSQLAIQYPAPRRECPDCGVSRWADDQNCPKCSSSWGNPPLDSRSIINPV